MTVAVLQVVLMVVLINSSSLLVVLVCGRQRVVVAILVHGLSCSEFLSLLSSSSAVELLVGLFSTKLV